MAATIDDDGVDELIASDLFAQDYDDERAMFDQDDSDLPELPIGEHSFLSNDSGFGGKSDGNYDHATTTFNERSMQRHFADVESSFLPDLVTGQAKEQTQREAGVDDTYLELGRSVHTSPPDGALRSASANDPTAQDESPMVAARNPTEEEDADAQAGAESVDTSEEAQENPSSPAAAALQRTHVRHRPTGSDSNMAYIASSEDGSRPSTPGTQRPTSKGSTIRPGSSPRPRTADASHSEHAVSDNATSTLSRFATQRTLLRNQASQSSISSAAGSDLSGSDTAFNADYALQTGGSTNNASILGSSHRGNMLSRLPSYGSINSFSDRESDAVSMLSRETSNRALLVDPSKARLDLDQGDRPETPRAVGVRLDLPTDTVIAQHVKNIVVPDTIARDFRARNRSLSPNKNRPASSAGPSSNVFQNGPRRTLTLKEQNSKIDKLGKENFDLKLKIHFLDQALQSRSDEGVMELIDKNIQLQTDLANERKDSQALRRKVRDLEQKAKEQEDNLLKLQQEIQQSRSSADEGEEDDPTLQAEMHEEILYLRQQLDHSENKVTTLTEDVMTKELEKRKMAEHMRSMAGSRGEDANGMKETIDMWQDLLNAETGRREQAEEDIRKLREELTAFRIERASPAFSRMQDRSRAAYEESTVAGSEYTNGITGSAAASSVTLVEQLKHENAELRRDLGAQTSMLTSRNRERERLQQEIEDLKLLQRKSDGARSVAGDSIFDRSISRAHLRPQSRASEAPTHVTEAEREDWDKKEGRLRDQNAELRLKFQDLERTHTTHLQYVSALEGDFQQMETELNEATEDLRGLQRERDEALQVLQERDSELQKLEQEALLEIDKLEKNVQVLQAQLQDAHKRLQKTQGKLEHTTDGYKGLQGELREITQSVMSLEDEKQANMRTIQTLEQQLAETEDELQHWEAKCKEVDQKNRKLEITQESLHSEITFLREEQETDKLKIGELEDAFNAAQQSIQDEQEKLREMEEGIIEERQQRDVLENKSKEEVQKVLDDLNNENQKTKDDVRKLRRGLSAKEVEASAWKQKLEELEQSLRHVIGDPEGSKQSLLADVEKLQRDLESTTNGLDRAKMELADKERLIRHRDGLLESTSLESRRLSDLLDKERSSRRHDLEQFEKASRGQASNLRTIAHHESRVLEMEQQYTQDKRRLAALEEQYRDQLSERNSLLLALWNRLSTLCGVDWAQSHSMIDGELPSADVIARKLPAFNKNLLTAVKTVEALIGSFKVRIRSIEKDLWKDYQTLEQNLDARIRRMESLETAVQDTQKAIAEANEAEQRPSASRGTSFRSSKGSEEIGRLKSEMKVLKAELKFHRQHPSAMAQQMLNQQAQQIDPENARRLSMSGSSIKKGSSPARTIMSQLLQRHRSTSAVEHLQRDPSTSPPTTAAQNIVLPSQAGQPSTERLQHRLRELEKRLKAEREGRLLDRKGARQRLADGKLENEELKMMLEHERARRADLGEVDSMGGSERFEDERESDAQGSGVD